MFCLISFDFQLFSRGLGRPNIPQLCDISNFRHINLLHSERPHLHRVLAVVSAIGLNFWNNPELWFYYSFHKSFYLENFNKNVFNYQGHRKSKVFSAEFALCDSLAVV